MSWTLFWQLLILILWTSWCVQPIASKLRNNYFVNNTK